MTSDLAHRAVTSAAWNSAASVSRVVILFARSVILARLLPIEIFGIYTGASAFVALTVTAAAFGMGGAFLHRAPETEDEDRTASAHFTLRVIFTLLWVGLMIAAAALWTDGPTRVALLLLTATTGVIQLTTTPRLILERRVVHRRLALLELVRDLLASAAAVALAIRGATLWALLVTDVVAAAVLVIGLYLWRPVWRPRLGWPAETIRYFIRFGASNFVAVVLLRALDRLDDLWSRIYLGVSPTGLYSRAYTFATYPRLILATPLNQVAGGAYAELKGDRLGLSRAFFRTNAALLRGGFLLAGILGLAAPELIYLLIGAKWLPMLEAFRLMLVFTMLDPIKQTVAQLFVAVGRPQTVVRSRFVQLAVMVAGLYGLGPRLGIVGVALAVNLMLLTGIVLLLWQARAHVDFSVRQLFLAPAVALALGAAAVRLALSFPGAVATDWHSLATKILVFTAVYAPTLAALERRQLKRMFAFFREALRG